jgi:phosphoserine aminotransferase
MSRVYNFSAGPATLPEEVLMQASREMTDYNSTGMSVMEMSHRSPAYEEIINNAESLLRKLMNIPDNYDVLFLQGGASLQFSMIPMNIMTSNKKCDIINTGIWTQKAIVEAKKVGAVNIAASSEKDNFSRIPGQSEFNFSKDADYVHICWNNTIYGTCYREIPETSGKPLVADMSSSILSEKTDVSRFSIIFAGAQKNIGPAGVTIVIIDKELYKRIPENLPSMLDFRTHSSSKSLFNTPPTYSIYMAGLVFKWLDKNGGVEAMGQINKQKASRLYDFIDNSSLFMGNVDKEFRSMMNVTFSTGSNEIDELFVNEAEKNGLANLKGHKSAGGIRASIYNAMPVTGIDALIEFMKVFEKKHQ